MGDEPTAEERLKAELERFEASVPYGAALRAKLNAEGVGIRYLNTYRSRPDTWQISVELGEPLKRWLAIERVLLCVGPGVADRLVISETTRHVIWDTPPVYVTITQSAWPELPLRHPALQHEAQHVHWELCEDSANFDVPWSTVLWDGLRSTDLFEQRNPVPIFRGLTPRRMNDALRIADRLMRGGSFGCFGLRKAGKTSLLQQCARQIDRAKGDRVCWIDVQGIVLRNLNGLCQSLLRAMEVTPRAGEDALEQLDEALHRLTTARQRLWVVLDEYDLLFASPRGRAGFEGIERFFSLLRAHAQRSHFLSLAVIGRDPSHAQRPTMEGAPNPLLGWLATEWIGPLVESDARTLLTSIARRACLDAGPATVDAALRWTGSHPLLLRQFGSALRQVALPHIGDDTPLPTDPFVEQAIDAFLERDAVLEMCREVEHLLAEVYPDTAALFWSLVSDASHGARPSSPVRARLDIHGGWRTPQAQRLRNLGLLQGTADAPVVPELWRWWSSYLTWRPSASTG